MRNSGSRIKYDVDRMHSEPFIVLCRNGNPNVFVRNRKMPPEDLAFSMINRKGLTLKLELRGYLFLIDADRFKQINDRYGHTQGDAALERIADALRNACTGMHYRTNIARYGGDEFVLLVRTEDPKEIETLHDKINQCLSDLNREAKAPYDLTVSIGISRVEKGKTMKEVIEDADALMYEEKKSRAD